MFELG